MSKTNANLRAPDVLVVGGGVIGAATALELSGRGLSVTVAERARFGQGSSWGNCGLIVPGHVLPLNSWGNLVEGLSGMTRRDSPLYIRPRIDGKLLRWMRDFVRCCPTGRTAASAAARAPLLADSIQRWQRLVDRNGLDCRWETRGALWAFATRKGWEGRADEMRALKPFGIAARRLDRGELLALEPALDPGLAGAWHDPHAAHMRPDRLMDELARVLAERGVRVLEACPVTGFQRERGRVAAARTPGGLLPAGGFVVTTGAWTPQLHRALGMRLAIQPGKGYSTTRPAGSTALKQPCFFGEAHVVATPWTDGLRLGGTMEFSGYDDRLNPLRLAALDRAAARYLRAAPGARPLEEWCGWRPMTPDGLPFIGRPPALENVVVAAGHNMVGLTLAPVTAELAADLAEGKAPAIDLRPYRLDRFGK